MFPLDARAMTLFDTVEGKHHQYAMDDLYKSVTYFEAVYNQERKVLTHGVMRKGIRGIPPGIKQEGLYKNRSHI